MQATLELNGKQVVVNDDALKLINDALMLCPVRSWTWKNDAQVETIHPEKRVQIKAIFSLKNEDIIVPVAPPVAP